MVPDKRRNKQVGKLVLAGASANNIKNMQVEIPLGRITTITGVSGSGKSTLLYDLVYKESAA